MSGRCVLGRGLKKSALGVPVRGVCQVSPVALSMMNGINKNNAL